MSAVIQPAATDADASYDCLPLPELRDFIFAECGPEHRETVLGLLRESLGEPEEQCELYKEWRQAKSGDQYPGDQDVAREFAIAAGRKASVILAGVQDLLSARAGVAGERIGDIPESLDPCTDQANAHRLRGNFGDKVGAVGKQFYVFNDRYWEQDSATPTHRAAQLSRIVHTEAQFWRTKFEALAADNPDAKKLAATKRRDKSTLQDVLMSTANGAAIVHALNMAEKLGHWAKECESRPRQQNALLLWRDLCQIDPARLDTAPHLITCKNCTVDLRSGEEGIQPHNPADLITQFAPVRYSPHADCPNFKAFLNEVFPPETVAFLQRWYGYAATGETREQKVVFHIGDGSEGKSTLNDVIDGVMGSYAGAGARGLITGNGGENRHPTEVKALKGKRLVTLTESNADQDLQEGFMKSLTGGDKITGRGMYEDLQEWRPTHKLQLLSNYPPVVKGQDHGVWRRLLLVKYNLKFGSEAEVAAGKAHRIANPRLEDELLRERDGIFTWIVQGAKEWYANGLQPPANVLAETQKYRSDQDRVGQYVKDRCTVSQGAWVSYQDLYRDYQTWCFQSGYRALGSGKLNAELQRVIPSLEREDEGRKHRTADGKRKTFKGFYGVQLSNGTESAAERFPVLSTPSNADADSDFTDLL